MLSGMFTKFFWLISHLVVQTLIAAAYEETLKRLKEAIGHKKPGLLTKGVLLLHNSA
jgi:hypothetical protein